MARDLSMGKSANMIKDIASKSREESGKKTIKNISLNLIDMSEDNDKIFNCDDLGTLIEAIKRNGFQGTVEVYLKKDGRYGLLSGHRRYLSAQKIGMTEIPCEIVEEPSDTQKAEILIMSNIVARDLSPIERAKALVYYEEKVLKKDKTVSGDKRAVLAERFGIAGSQVHKLKALLKLIPELQKLIINGSIAYVNIYNASVLDEETQHKVYDRICKKMTENAQLLGESEGGNITGKEVVYIVNEFLPREKAKEPIEPKTPSVEPLNEKPIDLPHPEEAVDLAEDAPLSFMNVKPVSEGTDINYDTVEKQKPQKDMLYNEKRLFIGSQNLRYLINTLVGGDKAKLKSKEVIDELVELKELLNELF